MKSRFLTLFLAAVLFLSACSSPGKGQSGNEPGTDEESTDQSAEEKVTTTSNRPSKEYYRAIITDGEYKTSKSRGITQSLNSTFNLKAFETGLSEVSQKEFSTDTYFYQEGQYLDEKTINQWLRRYNPEKGENQNLEGLNPKDNGKLDENERAPIYLNSILEQDYMVQKDDGYQLGGISIGLAMNAIDYYQKEKYGAYFETRIDHDELLKQGKEMADKIVERLRKMEGLKNVPITVGIFEQSSQDSIAGGTYIASGTSKNGQSSIDKWEALNNSKVVFPSEGSDSNEKNSFANFKSEVETFFPNLSGITAEAAYTDDQLVSMKINIVTQFYGESEVIAFTQHVNDKATKFLPPNIPIEINISSIKGMEAFLARETGKENFYTHIFD